jgi:integrase
MASAFLPPRFAITLTLELVYEAMAQTRRLRRGRCAAKVLWDDLRDAAAEAGITKLAPHDLRRTCARLCPLAGGELDQIQFLLGHVFDSDDGALPRVQTEASVRRERSSRY